MLLGIDYGTTRTVVAAVDRGNYPVVSFQTAEGDAQDWYPSLIAVRGDAHLCGLDAARHQDDPDWAVFRSFKRQLAALGPTAQLPLGTGTVTALELLTAFLAQLQRDLVARSNLRLTPPEPLEAMIAVPANAHSNQRFLTLEAFRRAGFHVRGLLNEPSAAGIEYAHHARSAGPSAAVNWSWSMISVGAPSMPPSSVWWLVVMRWSAALGLRSLAGMMSTTSCSTWPWHKARSRIGRLPSGHG
jgi:molecular chaperone DnaK (HSP70)